MERGGRWRLGDLEGWRGGGVEGWRGGEGERGGVGQQTCRYVCPSEGSVGAQLKISSTERVRNRYRKYIIVRNMPERRGR